VAGDEAERRLLEARPVAAEEEQGRRPTGPALLLALKSADGLLHHGRKHSPLLN